ncbi:MAG: hypothetical protein IJ658_12230 [Kiritimatiellae bacterium]|nr:hypothetical protein [Kiritimatiellia bacterium]
MTHDDDNVRTMISPRIAAVLATACSLGVFLTAWADYDVLGVTEGGGIERYAVSADGSTWTKSNEVFMASTSARQMAAVGDGYIYIAEGSAVNRYDTNGTLVDTWKSDLSSKVRIIASPDRVWFYVGNDWNQAQNVARYRISNPAIGGFLALQDANHGGVNWMRNRHMAFGRDGLLYFGARGDTTGTGVADPLRGVFVYDPTVSGVPFCGRYKVSGGTAGVGVIVDDDRDRIYAIQGNACTAYNRGIADTFNSFPPGTSNPFFGVDLGNGGKFFGDYGNKSVFKMNLANGALTKIVLDQEKLCGLSDVTAASTTDSQLPNINGVWYMNETASASTLVNGAQPGTWDMSLSGDMSAGKDGASRGGVFSRDGGRGVIAASTQIVPQTGDFTVGLWVYAVNGTARTLLSNGAATLALGADGKPRFTACGVTASGASSIWDEWHWLVVRRNGGDLELWVDNVRKATQPLDPTAGIDQTVSWTLGADYDGGNASGPVFFDELRIYPVLLTADDMTLLYNLVKPEVKPPLGSELSSVALGNVCYAALNGDAYASTDGGATWTRKGTIGLDAASLFVSDGALYAAGRNAAGSLALATASNDGASWSVVRVGAGLTVPSLVATQPVVSGGRVWLGAPSTSRFDPMTVSFAFANGTAGDPQVSQAIVPPHESNLYQSHEWLYGCAAVAMTNGTVCTMGSSKSRYVNHGETILLSTNGTAATYCGALGFPGGSKPFSVVWDGTTRRYWMVTAACHHGDRIATASPDTQAKALSLYSSDDIFNWRYHRDLVVAGCPFYYRPSAAIVGEDVVVTFLDSSFATSFRTATFANFRAAWERLSAKAKGFHKQELFLPESDDGWVLKYYHDEATDDWIPAGVFCRNGLHGGFRMEVPINVRPYGDSVFVSTRAGDFGIYEFDKSGAFLRFYGTPAGTDGFSVSLDGKKLYATAWWGTKVYMIDRETGTVTTKDFGAALNVPRGVADVGGGKLAITSRGTCSFLIYDTQTDSYVTYGRANFSNWNQNQLANDGPMDVQFDAEKGRLWMYGSACGLGYYDMAAGDFTVVSKESQRYYHGFTFWKDSILCSIYTPSRVVQINPVEGKTVNSEVVVLASLGRALNRLAVVDMPQVEDGTLVLVR